MIDEKKLIEALLHDDGMEFTVRVKDHSPETVCNAFQEFADKMKEGFINLINAQPKILIGIDLAGENAKDFTSLIEFPKPPKDGGGE